MKPLVILGVISIVLATMILTVPPARAPAGPGGSWRLVFDDEFNGARLDTAKWSTRFPWGARTIASNHELEWYVDDAFHVANGMLRIRANRHRAGRFGYTSGMITSYASFSATYGYVVIRAKLPKGRGLWPAFWLLPHDQGWPPEIDVFEATGNSPNTVQMTSHYRDAAGATQQIDQTFTGPDFSRGFHTFAVAWSRQRIIWYVDGVERFQTGTGVPSKPMYVLVNLAVGGDTPGAPDRSTAFPSYLDVDYIRIYQRAR